MILFFSLKSSTRCALRAKRSRNSAKRDCSVPLVRLLASALASNSRSR
jgi:hypothetical protein